MNNRDIFCFTSDDAGTAASAGAITWTGPITIHDDGGANDEDEGPKLATDGAGTWICVWDKVYAAPPAGDSANNASDAWVSVSTDNGSTWGAAIRAIDKPSDDVNGTATEDGDHDIAYGDGTWVISFKSGDATSGPQSDEDVFTVASTDNGATWAAPVAVHSWESTDIGDDDNPQIAFDPGSSRFIVVWHSDSNVDGRGSDVDVVSSYADSTDVTTWTVVEIDDAQTDAGGDENPMVGTDSNGNIIVTWGSDVNDDGTYDIDYSMSTDGGDTYSAPANIEMGTGDDDDIEGRVGASPEGTFYAVWHGNGETQATVAVLDFAPAPPAGAGDPVTADCSFCEEGDTINLFAPTGAAGPFQWFRNGVAIVDGGRFSGATTDTLTISPALEEDSGSYRVNFDDGRKAIVLSAPFQLTVLAAGSLPAAAPIALAFLAFALVTATVLIVGRKRARV